MVRRSGRGAFASALVFPGGALDADDESAEWASVVADFDAFVPEERARRIAAIRETWEETSILVTGSAGAVPPASAHRGTSFRELVEQSGAAIRLDAITPFAHWITPVSEPRRFDTRFYLAQAPAGQSAVADGGETVGIEWISPARAVAAGRSGELPIVFPTLMNLERLAESTDSAGAVIAARARPPFTVQPVFEQQPDGSIVITIPAGAGYPVTRFSSARQP
jgi:8-oxo-dGTP pyrophosphatase MutT (NUDIX family)